MFLEEPTHRSPRKTTETMSPRIMGSSGCRPSCQGLKLQVGAALDFHLLTQTSGSRSWAHLPSCSVHEIGSGLRICINFMQIWVQYFFQCDSGSRSRSRSSLTNLEGKTMPKLLTLLNKNSTNNGACGNLFLNHIRRCRYFNFFRVFFF